MALQSVETTDIMGVALRRLFVGRLGDVARLHSSALAAPASAAAAVGSSPINRRLETNTCCSHQL